MPSNRSLASRGSSDPLDDLPTAPPVHAVTDTPTQPAPQPAAGGGSVTIQHQPYTPPAKVRRDPVNARLPVDLIDRMNALRRDTGEPVQSILERALTILLDIERPQG